MLHQVGPSFYQFGIDRGLETLAILSTLAMFLIPLAVASLFFFVHLRRNKRVTRLEESAPLPLSSSSPGQLTEEGSEEEYRHAA